MNSSNRLKKKRAVTPPTSTLAHGASTSTAGGRAADDGLTSEDALRTASTALEALKSVGDAAGVLGPLKAICGVLKIVVDTAVLLKNNGEDLRDLVDKLEHHRRFLEKEIKKLSEPEYSKSDNVEEIVEPLQDYLSNLQKLYSQLESLKTRYDETSKRKRVKIALKAQSDQGQIVDCIQKLEDSFRQFMNAMTSFIARQTLLLRNDMAELSRRLAEKDAKDALSQLAYADARGNQHETCMEGTREALLESIAIWTASSTPVFALVDQAGTGKSTIAAHMTRQWEKDGLLLARHFFSKPSTVTGKDLTSTLARDITENAPMLRPAIIDALDKHPNFTACSIREQLEWIVFTPLRSLDTMRILVVDALDECSKDDRIVFLKQLLDFVSSYPTGSCPLKLFLTCRPEDDLVSCLREPRYVKYIDEANFQLRPEEHPSNEADIRLYAMALLSNLLTDEQIDEFVLGAKGLFIWASTAYIYLKDALDPSARFQKLMKRGMTLELLYGEIIDSALKRAGDQEEILVKVLQAVCVAREPLTVEMMDELLGLQSGVAARVVRMLSSVLSDGNEAKPVHVLHPTFLEYLLNPQACRLGISAEGAEALVATGCLGVCTNLLKYDICEIHHPPQYPPRNKDIKNLEMLLRENMTPALRYAAINVLSHVGSSLHDREVVDGLRRLFSGKLLNWIELMSLCGKIYSLIQSILTLKTLIEKSLKLSTTIAVPVDVDWCSQIWSMVQAFQGVIEKSAMQVYFSALSFEPPTSHIARFYLPKFAKSIPRVIRGVRNSRPRSTILCGHTGSIRCIAYAPDGHTIASGSFTVRLWDPTTGAATAELAGHTDRVNCLEFSPDSKVLASASDDGTVRLWDPSTRAAVTTLTGHTDEVKCLAFSPKGKVLASGSKDYTIRLWDATTGTVIAVFTAHSKGISCLVFSPDGEVLASGAYEPDNEVRTSGSHDNTVRLWDPKTGSMIAELAGHTDSIRCVAFSPDGKILASGSNDSTVRLWNPKTCAVVAELNSHAKVVCCLAFSPNSRMLAFASTNTTVQIWDLSTGTAVAELSSVTNMPLCLTFSPDGKMLASGSWEIIIQVWDPSTGTEIAKLTGHTKGVKCLTFSPDSKILFSGSLDNTARLWDPSASAEVAEMTEHLPMVTSLAFSPDGQTLASGSHDKTLRLWNTLTGATVLELGGPIEMVNCVTFSPDGKMLASASIDSGVRFWDALTGAMLSNYNESVDHIVFSSDGKRLALGSPYGRARLWCLKTGAAGVKLTRHIAGDDDEKEHTNPYDPVKCLAFSPDGKMLASATSESQTVRLWVSNTCQTVGDPLLHDHDIKSLQFYSKDSGLFLIVDDLRGSTTTWNLRTNPPSHHFGEELSPPQATSPIQFKFPWTCVPPAGISFQVPPHFVHPELCSHKGIAAYGGEDGSVIIVDCTHLI